MLNHGPIQEVPLSHPFFRKKVEAFLQENGLRMDPGLDHYYAFFGADGEILAGAGMQADIIKCVAVSSSQRSEGLLTPLVSRLMSDASAAYSLTNFKVFTKPENAAVFESLGFKVIASAPQAVLMENGRGLEKYCEYLRSMRRPGRSGVVVMNANPFTLGHKYLIDKASEQVDTLYIIPVKEDASEFPYTERLAMIASALPTHADASALPTSEFSSDNASPTHTEASVVLLDGCDYVISSATFPTYFLKDLSAASETQMQLDLDLFCRRIAPALGATVRFVGSEPHDALTARYNELMAEILPEHGLTSVIIPRICHSETPTCHSEAPSCHSERSEESISASAVRSALSHGDFRTAASLTPATTHPYLLAALAQRALLLELDTPLKPGLVGPDGPGAHKDMDYDIMLRGISALRPFWSRMAMASDPDELRQLGIDAESAMMEATGGVNTHRGAIFALGVAVNTVCRRMEVTDTQLLMQNALHEIVAGILRNTLTDKELHSTLIGARRIALTGYKQLFEDWLPFYRNLRSVSRRDTSPSADKRPMLRETCPSGTKPNPTLRETCPSGKTLCEDSSVIPSEAEESPAARQALLLRIMSTLDDTCVIKRVGKERAELVKQEAAEIAGQAGNDGDVLPHLIGHLCTRYAEEGISPGGAADMLALTIFIDSII